jgi:molecular chaperone GrpE
MKLHPAAELAALKTALESAADRAESNEKYLRLAAEFDNFKKRTARQFAEIVKNANEDLVSDLLGILDDFGRAIQTMEEGKSETPVTVENLRSGMRLIIEKLMNVLGSRGVAQFDPQGQPFDPQYHDAVMQMPSDKEEGTIIGVISPGYTMNDKVIRHAKVIVASAVDK